MASLVLGEIKLCPVSHFCSYQALAPAEGGISWAQSRRQQGAVSPLDPTRLAACKSDKVFLDGSCLPFPSFPSNLRHISKPTQLVVQVLLYQFPLHRDPSSIFQVQPDTNDIFVREAGLKEDHRVPSRMVLPIVFEKNEGSPKGYVFV